MAVDIDLLIKCTTLICLSAELSDCGRLKEENRRTAGSERQTARRLLGGIVAARLCKHYSHLVYLKIGALNEVFRKHFASIPKDDFQKAGGSKAPTFPSP